MKRKELITVIKESFSEWSKDNASTLAAALSYYSMFSLAPILVIIVSVAGFILGSEGRGQQLIRQVGQFVGPQIADMLQSVVQKAHQGSTGLIATIISAVVVIIGAAGVFYQLRKSLNIIWEVEPKQGKGIKYLIKNQVLSFLSVFFIGFLLFVALAASTSLSELSGHFEGIIPGGRYAIQGINVLIFFVIGTLLFAAVFKLLPDAEIAWSDVWIGAAITSILFSIGKFAIGLYLGKSTMASPYGAAGSLVILLAFIYYASNIFFIGAEFTQIYSNHFGSKIVPSEHGQPTPHEEPSEPNQPSEPEKEKSQPGYRRPQPAGGQAH